jgi:hypothetical protein
MVDCRMRDEDEDDEGWGMDATRSRTYILLARFTCYRTSYRITSFGVLLRLPISRAQKDRMDDEQTD